MKKRRIIEVAVLVIGVFGLIAGLWFLDRNDTAPQIEDPQVFQDKLFKKIQKTYILDNGFVMSEENMTTSESQSYAMLIAALQGDRILFDNVWAWTKTNLKREDDALFSWLWRNGAVVDKNTATDADQDIALALLIAYNTWRDDAYLYQALAVMDGIWEIDVKEVGGKRYVSAGNWSDQSGDGVVINPSYLAPYIYRIFARYDTTHDWSGLIATSYETLNSCTSESGLGYDWCKVFAGDGVATNFTINGKAAFIYSYDALRIPFRIALDEAWFNGPDASSYLETSDHFFEAEWLTHDRIYAQYSPDGNALTEQESLASYGAHLAGFTVTNRTVAKEIYDKKIGVLSMDDIDSFYSSCWLWFGVHFYDGAFEKALPEGMLST